MATGCLEVKGTIDLAQFWPDGEADADTTKVKVQVGRNAFRFRPDDDSPFRVTHAFFGATVKGRVRKAPIDKHGRVTIRLQGIDAPELHYRPQAPKLDGKKPTPAQRKSFNAANANFRQPLAETATLALARYLARAGGPQVPCVVRTAVDDPSDVFDTYGRLVGDIYVRVGAEERHVNHWLAESGWAQPSLYASMSDVEITDLVLITRKARYGRAGVWKHVTSNVTRFDPQLVYRRHGPPDPAADRGAVVFPKLFRRLATYRVCKTAKLLRGSFDRYLQEHTDGCYERDDFLRQGTTAATHRRLDEFVSAGGRLLVQPEALVFQESPSMVVDAAGKAAVW